MSKVKSSSTSKSIKSTIPAHLETKDGRGVTTRAQGIDEELTITFMKNGRAFTTNSILTPILESVGKIQGSGEIGLCG